MTTLLAMERIKLFSTRSPWWSTFLAIGMTVGFAALLASQSDSVTIPLLTGPGSRFGLIVVMVMAALTVTTEYRFGTIRATFQAVPNRSVALLAKTAVVAFLALLIGEVAGFGSWAIGSMLAPQADLALDTAEAWRQVAGLGPMFALAAVLAVAVGVLLRQTAGAVTVIMLWSLLVESLIAMIPNVGMDIQEWMPFTVVERFLKSAEFQNAPLGPWGSLAYFAAISAALLGVALAVAHRRDA